MTGSQRRPDGGPPDLAGDLEVLGLLPGSSNYTFLARLAGDPGSLVVYKPRQGEAPLWDFPSGTLCQREAAAYEVGVAAGWGFVPATVLRDGPLGEGAVQRFVRHDPSVTAFDLLSTHVAELRAIALFDLVTNNADRKAGHVLVDGDGATFGIDHGLCFHEEPKLRTVLWHFVGKPLTDDELARLFELEAALAGDLAGRLEGLLTGAERQALLERTRRMIESPVFPEPGPGRPIPWPPV